MKIIDKAGFYINEYVRSVNWLKITLMPMILALIVSNYLEIQCSYFSANMTSGLQSNNEGLKILKAYVIYFILGNTLKYIVNLFNAEFIGTAMRNGFKNFFKEYLLIKYIDFQKIGIGEAQYNINRRAYALTDFLTTISMTFVSNLFFFFLVIHFVNSKIPVALTVKIYLAVILFILFSIFIQIQRTKLRRKVNNGLQKNSRKLYDILLNYERIVTYDNIEVECDKYYKSMDDQVFFGIFYWVSYELVGFLNCLFFIFLNIYLIQNVNDITNLTVTNLKQFIMVTTKLKEKVFDISKDIDDICTSFTNLDQSAISNCSIEANNSGIINEFKNKIEIKNLNFNFDSRQILRNIESTIKKGEKIAITGTNGSGKSTFIKILLGFYDYEGSILIDGCEYKNISKKSLRNIIAYVPQASFLFDMSILENLLIGNNNISHDKMIEYCKLYDMHNLFKELGYSKQVGERGKNLSGGQRQKICFMRAVLKNTPILILDEATSNLDKAAENDIIRKIKMNMANKTVIMIIHNLELLKHFDKVLFFNNSQLQEQGSFERLYDSNDLFREFYDNSVKSSNK